MWRNFHGPNAGYVLELYDRYRKDPNTVDAATRAYFDRWTPPVDGAPPAPTIATGKIVGVVELAHSIRAFGHLAARVDPLGSPPLGDPVRLPWPEARAVGGALAGVVLHVDRFGNLITSIRAGALAALGAEAAVRVGGRTLRVVSTYGDLRPHAAGALVGSEGRLEIAVREGSAAAQLRARRGTPVVVSRSTSRRAGSTTAPGRPGPGRATRSTVRASRRNR